MVSPTRSCVPSAALLAALVAAPVCAQKAEFAGLKYAVPNGWQEAEKNDRRLILRRGNGNEVRAQIVVAADTWQETDLAEVVRAAATSAVQGQKETGRGEVQKSRSDEGYDLANLVVETEDARGGRHRVQFLGVHAGRHLILFALAVHDLDKAATYAADFDQFLKDFDVPDTGAPAPAGGNGGDAAEIARLEQQRAGLQRQLAAIEAQLERLRGARPAPGTAPAPAPAPAGATAPGAPPAAPVRAFDAKKVAADQVARRKPGIVSGNVYDALGRPFALAGARVTVTIWGTTFAGEKTHFELQIDDQGHYEQELPKGLYRMHANALLTFEGEQLPVEFHELDEVPFDQNQNSTAGIVKDWILRLSGERAGGSATHGWHGGYLCVCDALLLRDAFDRLAKQHPKGSTVRVVLEPKGPLADGTPGQRVVMDCDLEKMSSGAGDTRVSIPFGRYVASAAVVEPGGKQVPLWVAEGMGVTAEAGRTCELVWRMSKEGFGDTVGQVFLAVAATK